MCAFAHMCLWVSLSLSLSLSLSVCVCVCVCVSKTWDSMLAREFVNWYNGQLKTKKKSAWRLESSWIGITATLIFHTFLLSSLLARSLCGCLCLSVWVSLSPSVGVFVSLCGCLSLCANVTRDIHSNNNDAHMIKYQYSGGSHPRQRQCLFFYFFSLNIPIFRRQLL